MCEQGRSSSWHDALEGVGDWLFALLARDINWVVLVVCGGHTHHVVVIPVWVLCGMPSTRFSPLFPDRHTVYHAGYHTCDDNLGGASRHQIQHNGSKLLVCIV